MSNTTGCIAGKAYSFKFGSDFSVLDGIYYVTKIMTWDEMLNEGIDLVPSLYSVVGKTNDDYKVDYLEYRKYDVFKLTHVSKKVDDEDVVYYIPISLITERPDPRVQPYARLVIMLDLGVFANQEQLSFIENHLAQELQAATGIISTPELVAYETEWMKESEYTAIEASREVARGQVVNYHTRYVSVAAQLEKLKTKLKAYEELIVQLTPPKDPNAEP